MFLMRARTCIWHFAASMEALRLLLVSFTLALCKDLLLLSRLNNEQLLPFGTHLSIAKNCLFTSLKRIAFNHSAVFASTRLSASASSPFVLKISRRLKDMTCCIWVFWMKKFVCLTHFCSLQVAILFLA